MSTPRTHVLRLGAALALAAATLSGCVLTLPGGRPPATTPADLDVEDFDFESFEGDYELGRDADGVSTLRTTEHFVALFPDFDQNRGMIRSLYSEWQGVDTELEIVAVTDGDGAEVPFEIDSGGGRVEVLIGDESYVHGRQEYVIEYEQRHVIVPNADGRQLFWARMIDAGFPQDFGMLTARVELDAELLAAYDGEGGCFRTPANDAPCPVTHDGTGVEATAEDVAAGGTALLTLHFPAGTFTS